jgi:hypothetical protein
MSIKIIAHPSKVRRLSYCLIAHHSSCETASKQSYDMTWSVTDSSPVLGAVKFVTGQELYVEYKDRLL